MLKVQPRFKLDRCYKGPFAVESLTATNAVIKVRGDNSAEPWNVSRQCLSKCHPGMEQVKPWIGPTNKLRRHRRMKRLTNSEEKGSGPRSGQNHSDSNQQSSVGIRTRCSRTIRKPPIICVSIALKCYLVRRGSCNEVARDPTSRMHMPFISAGLEIRTIGCSYVY